jgi:RimJ/RimL family protein N-acetyltransferase
MTQHDVVLRPAAPGDAPFLQRLRSDAATAEYLAVSSQNEADLRAELAAPGAYEGRLIATGHDGAAVAALKWALVNRRSRIAELAEVIVAPDCRGQRIGTAAVRAACRWLIEEHDVHRVQLEVYGDNHAAQRAFQCAGFAPEGVRRQAYWRRQAWQDGILYGLVGDERP